MERNNKHITEMLTEFGYNEPKPSSDINRSIEDIEREGYTLSSNMKEIIASYYKMSFRPVDSERVTDNDIRKGLSDLENRFIVDPDITILKEETDRMADISEIIKDQLIPIGIYNGNFLSVGKSNKIYSVVPSVRSSVDLLGENFDDFLVRYYCNSKPIFTWIL